MQNSALVGYGRSSFLFFASVSKNKKNKPSSNLRAMSSSSKLSEGREREGESEIKRKFSGNVESVEVYHQETKHGFGKYARGPHGLDWANQPNPFRRYTGAPVVLLDRFEPGECGGPSYAQVFGGLPSAEALSRHTLSRLFFDSLALSAWKSTGYSTWSLRVNPSSGNLHPTEGYLVSGPVGGVSDQPFVAHYAPKEHALEIRAELPVPVWEGLVKGFPQETVFVGLTSIFWREAWKYGERAFRYCNHDVGHAIAAVSIAAACVGWDSVLLDGWGNDEINELLGLEGGKKADSVRGPTKGYFPNLEQEHGDCLIALFPGGCNPSNLSGPSDTLSATLKSCMARVEWKGKPNALSKEHVAWGIIYQAALASHKHVTAEHFNNTWTLHLPSNIGLPHVYEPLTLRQVVQKRRSAVDMDGSKGLQSDTFYQMLLKASPSNADLDSQGLQQQLPFRVLPWKAELHMALFVHRVIGLPMGLYFLVRNSEHEEALRAAMKPDFEWVKPQGCPENLPLYRLASGDCRAIAKRLSCLQDIAGDGCFSLGMIARFKSTLDEAGAWMYPRLFWESGVIGQVLYLEAHAVGISATGIGCYFDDAVHEVLGIKSKEFQSLYHFTVGAPVVDKRIMSLPPYPGPALDA